MSENIMIVSQAQSKIDNINHFDLRSDFENNDLKGVTFIPEGKVSAEPESWSIECTDGNEYFNTYQYDSKNEYEQDVQLLETLHQK